MSASTLLVVFGRVDENVSTEKLSKLIQNGLSYVVRQDSLFLDSEFNELVQNLPEAAQTDEVGHQITLDWSSARKRLLIQFNPTCEQFHACLRTAMTQAVDVDRERIGGTNSSPIGGRIYVIYGGQVSVGTGDWLLSDSTQPGYQLLSWLNSEHVTIWRPQLKNFADFGDKLRLHVFTPSAGPNTSWPMEKRFIRSHVGVRFVNVDLIVESALPFKEYEMLPTTGDVMQHLTNQMISRHPKTLVSLNVDGSVMDCALSAQRPMLYIFPGAGSVSNALLALRGFTLLLGGSYGNQSLLNWWTLTRNLPRLDAILFNEWSPANIISQHFLENLSQSSNDGTILGEVLVPSVPAARDATNELFFYPPTGIKDSNYSSWVPSNTKFDALPAAMVLYYKLGFGELKLQPLSFRAGLLFFWKSASSNCTKESSLIFLLPTHQVIGGCPIQGLTRLLKTLESVKQLMRTVPVNKSGVSTRITKPSKLPDPRTQKPSSVSRPLTAAPSKPPTQNTQRPMMRASDRSTNLDRKPALARPQRTTVEGATKLVLLNRPATAPQRNMPAKTKPSTEKRLNDHSKFVAKTAETNAWASNNTANLKAAPVPIKRPAEHMPTKPEVPGIKPSPPSQLSYEYSELAAVDPLNSGWSGLDQSMHHHAPSELSPLANEHKKVFDKPQNNLPIDSGITMQEETELQKPSDILDKTESEVVIDEEIFGSKENEISSHFSLQQYLHDEEVVKTEEASLNTFLNYEEDLTKSPISKKDHVETSNEWRNETQLSPVSHPHNLNGLNLDRDPISVSSEQEVSNDVVLSNSSTPPDVIVNEEMPLSSDSELTQLDGISHDDTLESSMQKTIIYQSPLDMQPFTSNEESTGVEIIDVFPPSNIPPVETSTVPVGDAECVDAHNISSKCTIDTVVFEEHSNEAATKMSQSFTGIESEALVDSFPQTKLESIQSFLVVHHTDEYKTDWHTGPVEQTLPLSEAEGESNVLDRGHSALLHIDHLLGEEKDAAKIENIVEILTETVNKYDDNDDDDDHHHEARADSSDNESRKNDADEHLLISEYPSNLVNATISVDDKSQLPVVELLPETKEISITHPSDDLPDVLQHISSAGHSVIHTELEDSLMSTKPRGWSEELKNIEHSDDLERVVLPGESGIVVYDGTIQETDPSLDAKRSTTEPDYHDAPVSEVCSVEQPFSSKGNNSELLSPTDSLDDKMAPSEDILMQQCSTSLDPSDNLLVLSNSNGSGSMEGLASTIIPEEASLSNAESDYFKIKQSVAETSKASHSSVADLDNTVQRQSSDVSDISENETEYSISIKIKELDKPETMLRSPSDVIESHTDTTIFASRRETPDFSLSFVKSYTDSAETVPSGQLNISDADSTTTITATYDLFMHSTDKTATHEPAKQTIINGEELNQPVHSTTADRQVPTSLFFVPLSTNQQLQKELLDSGSPGSEASIDSVVEVPHTTDSVHQGYSIFPMDRLVDDSDQVSSSFTDIIDSVKRETLSEQLDFSDHSFPQTLMENPAAESADPYDSHKSNGHDMDAALLGGLTLSDAKFDIKQPGSDSAHEVQNKILTLNKNHDHVATQRGDEFSAVDPLDYANFSHTSPVLQSKGYQELPGEPTELPDSGDNLIKGSTFDPLKDWGHPQSLPPPPAKTYPIKTGAPSVTTITRTTPANQRARVPENLPPGSPVFVDVFWVPAYLSSVPFTMAIEFFTRVRARIYVLSSNALHPIVGEALIAAKAQWNPNDLSVLLQGNTDPSDITIKILPTDEPYDWVCWLQTPCGRENGETGEGRLKCSGFQVMPAANLSDISFNNGLVTSRCQGVSLEL